MSFKTQNKHAAAPGPTVQQPRDDHSGIHRRRNKGTPYRSGRIGPEDLAEANAYEAAHEHKEVGAPVPEWQKALMLWLSWNSTHEKLAAKMGKPGQNQEKLARLRDELEELRSQALTLSEKIVNQVAS